MGVSARIGKRGTSIDKHLHAAKIFRGFFGGRGRLGMCGSGYSWADVVVGWMVLRVNRTERMRFVHEHRPALNRPATDHPTPPRRVCDTAGLRHGNSGRAGKLPSEVSHEQNHIRDSGSLDTQQGYDIM